MERLCALVLVFICIINIHPGAGAIGINYGLLGDSLPAPAAVVRLLKSRNISRIRIFEPDRNVLNALRGSGISVIIGTLNQDLQSLATDYRAAARWIQTNVLPYHLSVNIRCIAAGNEVVPGELAQYVPEAMHNLHSAMRSANMAIPVTTAVSLDVLSVSYPPSGGAFSGSAMPVMTRITRSLAYNNFPLLLNAYPYFARAGDPANIPLDYALFKEGAPIVHDGGRSYDNMFDAMVDATYSALEKVGGQDVEIVVSETGWPTAGGTDASIENARTYVNNLIGHVWSRRGTPKRPGREIETYIFALFNEDLKPTGVQRNWGLYYSNMTEVYRANL